MQHTAAATAFLLIFIKILYMALFETNIYYVLNTLQIVLFSFNNAFHKLLMFPLSPFYIFLL